MSVWPLSIRLLMLVGGKGDALAIAGCARISSISVGALSSTICMFWLVPNSFRLSFSLLLDYLTDALALPAPCVHNPQRAFIVVTAVC